MRGLGQHFESPRRPRDKCKTQFMPPVSIVKIKCRRLLARLDQLESNPGPVSQALGGQEGAPHDEILDNNNVEIGDDGAYFDPMDPDYVPSDVGDSGPSYVSITEEADTISDIPGEMMALNHCKWCILPNPPAQRLYTSWKMLISTLVIPHQHYMSRTLAKPLPKSLRSLSLCNETTCTRKNLALLCLFFDCRFPRSTMLFRLFD